MSFEKKENLKVVDLLKEQELLKAKYFASDDVPFIVKYAEENKYLESQMVAHYQECKKALEKYLKIEDILSGIYAEYTIEVMGFRFTVSTGVQLLRELQSVDHDKLTGHLIVSTHPMCIFLNKCYGGNMNYLPSENVILDPNHLLGDTIIEDVMWKADEFLIELGNAIQRFIHTTSVTE